MFILCLVLVALVVYGLGPDLNGDVFKDICYEVKQKLIKMWG